MKERVQKFEDEKTPAYAVFMTPPASKKRCSVEEYLGLEAAAEVKQEYHAGEILAMSGGTDRHSRITANLIRYM